MNNADDGHSWRQQPASHFSVNCGLSGQPDCVCWPKKTSELCFTPSHVENIPAPSNIAISSLEDDGSVVKISFVGEVKSDILRIGNYMAFADGGGCYASATVKYRVYVRWA